MTRRPILPAAALAVTATAAFGGPAVRTIQATQSASDTSLERFPVVEPGRWAAVRGAGDLTPGAPGNAAHADQIWRVDLFTGALLQATASSSGDVRCPRVTVRGNLIVSSQEDLTPGLPGNADGSFEAWYFDPAAPALRQLTASDGDTFYQTSRPLEPRAFFVSKGDLTPGAPGNPEGRNDVFVADFDTFRLRQVTDSPGETLLRGVTGPDSGVVESTGDLVTGNNTDGSREVFRIDLRTGALDQITDSDGDSRFADAGVAGRVITIESRADLVPGHNADGSMEVFAHDRRTNRLVQVTSSAGDSHFAAFVPHSTWIAVHSREDLVPGGNADGSQEVFLVDRRTHRVRQLTASSGDSTLLAIGDDSLRWAVIASTGDLRPDVPGGGTGSRDLYLQRIRGRATRAVRLTSGDDGAWFAGFGLRRKRIAIDTTDDLVPGGNTDGSREVYLVTLRGGGATPHQVTSSPADSFAAAISPAFRVVVIESRGDLVPGGNADGSLEVYLHLFGPVPLRYRGPR